MPTCLRLQVKGLKQELRDANDALEAAKTQSSASVKALKVIRNVFEGQHRALQIVFGELDAAGIEPESTDGSQRITGVVGDPSSGVHRKFAYWEAWITKLGGKVGLTIKVLLEHGRMNRNQIREATQSGWSTVDSALSKLKGLDLIQKTGDYWSLQDKV